MIVWLALGILLSIGPLAMWVICLWSDREHRRRFAHDRECRVFREARQAAGKL